MIKPNGRVVDRVARLAKAAKLKETADASPAMLSWTDAITAIAKALHLHPDAAMTLLYGLCAAGLRAYSTEGFIDPDTSSMNDFQNVASVSAEDLDDKLAEWSADPLSSGAKVAVIRRLLAKHNPPRNISWKEFCDLVRDQGHGWFKPGRPALGFSDKQIFRTVKALRSI
jgi:hypothetical protein